jgi:hypothetical protein
MHDILLNTVDVATFFADELLGLEGVLHNDGISFRESLDANHFTYVNSALYLDGKICISYPRQVERKQFPSISDIDLRTLVNEGNNKQKARPSEAKESSKAIHKEALTLASDLDR